MQTGEHPVDAHKTAEAVHLSAPALAARRTSPAPAYTPDEKIPLSEPISEEAEAAAAVHLPAETNAATIAFLIPFPPTDIYQTVKDKDKVPPFCLYGPLAPRLSKPAKGEKESLIHKAQRKMEEEEEAAKGADGVKAKAVRLISKGMSMTKSSGVEFLMRTPGKKELSEIRIFYPQGYPPEDLKQDFVRFVKTMKKRSQKNAVVSTALTPVALAFDTVAFVPGPFEIMATWAAASITAASRSTSIANGMTNDKVTLGFLPSDQLKFLTHRLHELCFNHSKKGTIKPPHWNSADGTPKRGAELAAIVLEALKEQLGDKLDRVEVDRQRIAEDLESMLDKSAKEYIKTIS